MDKLIEIFKAAGWVIEGSPLPSGETKMVNKDNALFKGTEVFIGQETITYKNGDIALTKRLTEGSPSPDKDGDIGSSSS